MYLTRLKNLFSVYDSWKVKMPGQGHNTGRQGQISSRGHSANQARNWGTNRRQNENNADYNPTRQASASISRERLRLENGSRSPSRGRGNLGRSGSGTRRVIVSRRSVRLNFNDLPRLAAPSPAALNTGFVAPPAAQQQRIPALSPAASNRGFVASPAAQQQRLPVLSPPPGWGVQRHQQPRAREENEEEEDDFS